MYKNCFRPQLPNGLQELRPFQSWGYLTKAWEINVGGTGKDMLAKFTRVYLICWTRKWRLQWHQRWKIPWKEVWKQGENPGLGCGAWAVMHPAKWEQRNSVSLASWRVVPYLRWSGLSRTSAQRLQLVASKWELPPQVECFIHSAGCSTSLCTVLSY